MKKRNGNRKKGQLHDVWRKLKKNKLAVVSMVLLAVIFFVGIFGGMIAPQNYAAQNYDEVLMAPNKAHLFGTDNFGRDIFSRILYGCKYTILIGFGATILAFLLGSTLGLLAAYYKKMDNIIMRIMDILSACLA